MGTYTNECEKCGDSTITDAWVPSECPFCAVHRLEAENKVLREELENIAHASMDDFVDYHEFKVWAQNRARNALECTTQGGEQ